MKELLIPPERAVLLAASHDLARVHPRVAGVSALELLVPKGWRAQQVAHAGVLEEWKPTNVARYATEDPACALTVVCTRLGHDVPLRCWLEFAAVCGAWQIDEQTAVVRDGVPRLATWAHRIGDGAATVRRTGAFVDGGCVFEVQVDAPPGMWLRELATLEASADSLDRVEAVGHVHAEFRRTHVMSGCELVIEAPASWLVEPSDPGTIDLVLRRDRSTRAWVHLRATRAGVEAIEARQFALRSELRARGYAARREAETCEVSLVSHDAIAPRVATRMHARTPLGAVAEVRAWFGESPRWSIDAMSVATVGGRAHLEWMRAMRVLELAFTAALRGGS
jgi:hypothetical protein